MENTISPTEAKEQLKIKKFGETIRLEFLNDLGKTNITDKNSNIIFDLVTEEINNIVWLLDETPQIVFAISGKINHEFDDFVTILLGFKNNKTAIISSNCVTSDKRRNCNIICTDGEISLDFLEFSFENNQKDNVQKIAEAAFLSSQKGIPIYLELK